jgi:hypothetical protein
MALVMVMSLGSGPAHAQRGSAGVAAARRASITPTAPGGNAPAVALVEAEVSPTDPLVLDVQNKLIASGLFGSVDVIDAFSTTPTVAQLQAYRAVLVWSDSTFANGTALGDNLHTYLTGGGGVVIAVFANTDPGALSLAGAFASNGDHPFTVVTQTQGTELTLGTLLVPGSPLLAGVTAFDGGTSSFNNPGALAAGATGIANYSNGTPLVATQRKNNSLIVGLNFWPPSNDVAGYPNLWHSTTDGVRLMTNALLNAGGVTTTSVSSDANPAVWGQTVTFTATVTDYAGVPTGAGTVQFTIDGVPAGAPITVASGVATLPTAALAAGAHAVTASFTPDPGSGFVASDNASSPFGETVDKATTNTVLAAAPNPSTLDQVVTFTATVTVAAPGIGTPTGTATFKEGATTLGSGTLDGSGVATFTTSTLPIGPHSITAVYGADANFAASTSNVASQTVNQAGSLTALTTSATPSVFGQAVTFTATVAATAPASVTPTGTATFTDGVLVLGTAALDGGGVATFTTTSLPAGPHSIAAAYGGDAYVQGSASSVLSQVVSKADQTITFGALAARTIGGPPFTVTAAATSLHRVTFASQTPIVCLVADIVPPVTPNASPGSATVTMVGVGTCTIAADQSGNENFNAAPQVTRSFSVLPDCSLVSIAPTSLALGVAGLPYSGTLTLTGGASPISWDISGALPSGISFSGGIFAGTPAVRGAFSVTVTGTDAHACQVSASLTLPISAERRVVTGAGSGGAPTVRAFDLTGTVSADFNAYAASFPGGVSVAQGDTNGDGVADIVTGSGPGGGPQVQVFDGATGALRLSFLAFEPSFASGVEVAAGDVTSDGFADVLVVGGCGAIAAPPVVRAFDGRTGAFVREYAIPVSGVSCGFHVAAGDVTGDGVADVVVGSGGFGLPFVVVLDGASGATVREFNAYDAAFRGGVYVAAADITGDGYADIVTGAGAGGGPHVRVFDGTDGAVLRQFMAYDPAFTGGVRVAAGDLNGDGLAEVITAAGPGGGPHVRVLDGATGTELLGVFAYDPSFGGGVFAGGPTPVGRMAVDVAARTTGDGIVIAGWALHEGSGTVGVDAIHAWAYPAGGGAPVFVGATVPGVARGDVASIFGGEFALAGFALNGTLAPGTYDLAVFARNSLTGLFDQLRVMRITVP